MARSLCDFSHGLLALLMVGGWVSGSSGRARARGLCLDNTPTKSTFYFELRRSTKKTTQQVCDFALDALHTGLIDFDFYTLGVHVAIHSLRDDLWQLLLDLLHDILSSSICIITEHLIMLRVVKDSSTALEVKGALGSMSLNIHSDSSFHCTFWRTDSSVR